MKIFFEKLAMAVNVFTPIVTLLFVCSAYLYIPLNGQRDEGKVEMEQIIVKKSSSRYLNLPLKLKTGEKQQVLIETKPVVPSCFTSSKFCIFNKPNN
jgi:hypothetical protein